MQMYRNILKSNIRERIIKSSPERAYEALIIKLERLLKEASKGVYADLLEKTIDALKATDNIKDALEAIRGYVDRLPEEARLVVSKDVYAVTKELYMAGFNLVRIENQGLNVAFNLKDIDALNTIGRHNIFWIGEYFEDVGLEINNLVREFYEQNYTKQQLAERLNERLKFKFKEDERYFEGLADHIATKTKELGRISGYERAGIKYVKVKAILDSRTSQICRQMHGRIISVERLVEQRKAILNAKSPEELKAAQRWIPSFTGRTKDLPQGVAGPPYHYRCRTTTVAHFEELEGEPVGEETYQYYDGAKTRKEKVLYRYYDKELGREIVLTESAVRHSKLSEDKLKAAMRSIVRFGESNEHKGQLASLSQNGVYLAFRDNVVWTGFYADKDYFKRKTIGGIRKWVEQLKSFFTAIRSSL